MQALQAKKLAAAKLAEQLSSIQVKTAEERVEHCKKLQYVDHEGKALCLLSHSIPSDNDRH